VDSVAHSRQEIRDLIIAFQGDAICWTGVKKLSEMSLGRLAEEPATRIGRSSSFERIAVVGSRRGDEFMLARARKSLAGDELGFGVKAREG